MVDPAFRQLVRDFENLMEDGAWGFCPRDVLPCFAELNEDDGTGTVQEDRKARPWLLVAQVKNDMTITKPTLTLRDKTGHEFALVFDGLGRGDLDFRQRGLKKGNVAIVRNALRTPPREQGRGQGFVVVGKGREDTVSAVPGPLERVVKAIAVLAVREAFLAPTRAVTDEDPGAQLRITAALEYMREALGLHKQDGMVDTGSATRIERALLAGQEPALGCDVCDVCEAEEAEEARNCTGCGEARYCGKVSRRGNKVLSRSRLTTVCRRSARPRLGLSLIIDRHARL